MEMWLWQHLAAGSSARTVPQLGTGGFDGGEVPRALVQGERSLCHAVAGQQEEAEEMAQSAWVTLAGKHCKHLL